MTEKILDFPTKRSEDVVSEIIKKEDFVRFKTIVNPGSSKGDNYVGEIYRVKTEGEKKDGSVKVLNLIIKSAPQSVETRETLDMGLFYLNEIFSYTTMLPAFERIQNEAGLEEHERMRMAKCYFCSAQTPEEFIVLEDLGVDGFKMYDRKKSLDVPHAKQALKSLARMHSLSFVLKKKDPNALEALKSQCLEVAFQKNLKSRLAVYSMTAKEKAVSSIENLTHREKLNIYTDNLFENICNLLQNASDEYSVICHGDSWTNNYLFKYIDGKPVDIRLLDWQVIRYSSPVTDLLYMIFACTDSDFRAAHYDELLKYYYSEMESFLEKFSIKAEEVYPSKVFQSDLKKFALFGMGMAIMTLLLFTCDSDDTPDIDQLLDGSKNTDFSKGKSAVLYNSRINGVVSDFIKYGYM